jgi:hypothetical protein
MSDGAGRSSTAGVGAGGGAHAVGGGDQGLDGAHSLEGGSWPATSVVSAVQAIRTAIV